MHLTRCIVGFRPNCLFPLTESLHPTHAGRLAVGDCVRSMVKSEISELLPKTTRAAKPLAHVPGGWLQNRYANARPFRLTPLGRTI